MLKNATVIKELIDAPDSNDKNWFVLTTEDTKAIGK